MVQPSTLSMHLGLTPQPKDLSSNAENPNSLAVECSFPGVTLHWQLSIRASVAIVDPVAVVDRNSSSRRCSEAAASIAAGGRMAAAAGTGRHPAMGWQPMRASMQAAAGMLQPSPGEKHARRQPVTVRKSTEQVSTQNGCKPEHHIACG